MARRIIKVFEETAGSYDEWYRRPVGSHAFQSELEGMERLLPPAGTGVDVGAGTGIFAEHLTTDERRIVCVDPSVEMLRQAGGRRLDAVLAVSEAFPLRPGSVDFSYMVTVLEFLPEPSMTLRSIRGVLRDGCPVVILFINQESSWGEKYSEEARGGDPVFSHAKIYRPEEVRALLEGSGFEPEASVGTLTGPPDEPGGEVELVPAGPEAGVIIVKARKTGIDQ